MKRPSVRQSVCLSHRSTAAAACGGFAAHAVPEWADPPTVAGADAQQQAATRRSEANAGSVILTAEGRG